MEIGLIHIFKKKMHVFIALPLTGFGGGAVFGVGFVVVVVLSTFWKRKSILYIRLFLYLKEDPSIYTNFVSLKEFPKSSTAK